MPLLALIKQGPGAYLPQDQAQQQERGGEGGDVEHEEDVVKAACPLAQIPRQQRAQRRAAGAHAVYDRRHRRQCFGVTYTQPHEHIYKGT